MPVDPFVVNQSKVNTWRRCRQEYSYRYVEELVPRVPERHFVFGTMVHRLIEEYAQDRDPFKVLKEISFDKKELFTAEKEMYGEIVEDCEVIMREYFAYWPKRDLRYIPIQDETGNERFAEHEFAIDLVPGITFKGQIDGLGRTPNRMRWMVENKTFASLPNDDHRWRNLQTVVYIRAVEELGWVKRVDGVCWNYIRSAPPKWPRILKSGALSLRDIVTLPSVVKAAIKEAKAGDYSKLIAQAEERRTEYFQRIFTPINATVFKSIFSGFVDSAKEMRKYHGVKKDKNFGRHCDWCNYESICRAELTGGDVDFVKEKHYTHEDPESHRRTRRQQGTQRTAAEGSRRKDSPKLRVVR